jgi:arylsulfatase A-like enzyme
MKIDCNKHSLLSSLLILTSLLVFLQLVLVVTHVLESGGAANFLYNPLITDIFTAPRVVAPLLLWLSYQILLYGVFIAVIWLLAIMCGELFKLTQLAVQVLGILWWCIAVSAVLLANNAIFPHSFFTTFTQNDLLGYTPTHAQYLTLLKPLLLLLLAGLGLTALQLCITILRHKTQAHHRVIIAVFAALLVAEVAASYQPPVGQWHAATKTRPNIIVIGLDALRPDFLDQPQGTPNIIKFVDSSLNFSHAYTLIAQTLPAWVTVLTGAGPKTTLARENLVHLTQVYKADTLPKRLQQAGYTTAFATDDSRFDYITKQFGFDREIMPRTGAAEFVIGEFNDLPLSNLLLRSALGKWLFPYNYANHEAIATYDPKNFMELIQQSLNHPQEKPLFLAVHFNVSGWPFGWYNSKRASNGVWYYRYLESIREADRQFGIFLQLLQQHNLLNNTIVVLMSDHGVTFGLPKDRAISEAMYQGDKMKLNAMDKTTYLGGLGLSDKKTLSTSYGYGGDLLSPAQLHVVLAFKTYGIDLPQGQRDAISTLTDIAPTLLDFLHLAPLAKQEGKSLVPVINGQAASNRDIYFETSSNSFLGFPTEPPLDSCLQGFIDSYNYDKATDAVYMQAAAEQKLLRSKQRGVWSGNWLLVELPGMWHIRYTKTGAGMTAARVPGASYMVLLDLVSGKWTSELTTAWAAAAPVKQLCDKLTGFYGQELQCKACCQDVVTQKS